MNRDRNCLLKGFRLGLLLQLSVGPMCLLVFNTSCTNGLLFAIPLVYAITLVDAIFISLAAIGVTALLKKNSVQIIITIVGSFVLITFGINIVFGVFDKAFLPYLNTFSILKAQSLFFQGILLTVSNPLTILFWGGIFTTKVAEENLSNKQLVQFGVGCVLSTISFLTVVAIVGNSVGAFIPTSIVSILNVVVGVIVCFFGVKMLYKKFIIN